MKITTRCRQIVDSLSVVELPLYAAIDYSGGDVQLWRVTANGDQTGIGRQSRRGEGAQWTISHYREVDLQTGIGSLLLPPYRPATEAEFDEQVAAARAFFEAAAKVREP